jgi:peptidyl-prolyl cis-trans isomerase B (cyclophilin B)
MNIPKVMLLVSAILISVISGCSAQKNDMHPGIKVRIKTTEGNLIIKLYDETPLHQKNFVKLVNEKYYDGILFHRLIKGFMMQAGDPDSKSATTGQKLGTGGPGYTINSEFKPQLFHKKGALSAARTSDEINPDKKSSGSQFYIVQGKTYTDEELIVVEKQMNLNSLLPLIRQYIQMPENVSILENLKAKQQSNDTAGLDSLFNSLVSITRRQHPEIKEFKYSDEQKKVYKTIGGTPFLDMNYTVFGEVIEGIEIVDKIAAAEIDVNDRPKKDIKIISMEIIN